MACSPRFRSQRLTTLQVFVGNPFSWRTMPKARLPFGAGSVTSRRRFLQGSAIAGAGLFSGPMILATEGAKPAAATTANTKLNVALIGAGGQGRGDMKTLLNTGQRIAAICDLDEKQIAQAHDR